MRILRRIACWFSIHELPEGVEHERSLLWACRACGAMVWCRHLRTIERAHGLEDILIAGVLSGNMTKDQYAEIVRSTKHCADCGKELP